MCISSSYAHHRIVGSFWHRRCGIGDGSIRCAVATEVPKHDTMGKRGDERLERGRGCLQATDSLAEVMVLQTAVVV